jgi:hypothetical protein
MKALKVQKGIRTRRRVGLGRCCSAGRNYTGMDTIIKPFLDVYQTKFSSVLLLLPDIS